MILQVTNANSTRDNDAHLTKQQSEQQLIDQQRNSEDRRKSTQPAENVNLISAYSSGTSTPTSSTSSFKQLLSSTSSTSSTSASSKKASSTSSSTAHQMTATGYCLASSASLYTASLAEAEPIDDLDPATMTLQPPASTTAQPPPFDDVEFVDNEPDESICSYEQKAAETTTVNKLSSELALSIGSLDRVDVPTQQRPSSRVQSPGPVEAKLSNEAREYWATIDFYNNSKMAFNKRCKSVKLKREKLNVELKQREECLKSKHVRASAAVAEQQQQCNEQEPSACTCVKCSIVYHESLIKGINPVTQCNKCNLKSSTGCKCCTASSSTNTNPTETQLQQQQPQQLPTKPNATTGLKDDFNQLEQKLFNIKHELVSLSETSLDVFQLLLQLSDTMLELNNQLSSSTNANQLLLLNGSNFNINHNILLNSSQTQLNFTEHDPSSNVDKPTHDGHHHYYQQQQQHHRPTTAKSTMIEDFLQKAFYSTSTMQHDKPPPPLPPQTPSASNSITNIINSINSRTTSNNPNLLKKCYVQTNNNGPMSPPASLSSMNSTPTSKSLASIKRQLIGHASGNNNNNAATTTTKSFLKQHQLMSSQSNQSIDGDNVPSSSRLIENLYDKTSVTQFVDSLLNHNHINESSSSSSSSSSYSNSLLLAPVTDDGKHHYLDDEMMINLSETTSGVHTATNTPSPTKISNSTSLSSNIDCSSMSNSLNRQCHSAAVASAAIVVAQPPQPPPQHKISTTTSITNQILSRQPLASIITNQTWHKSVTNKAFSSNTIQSNKNSLATPIKSSSSSSSSSSSGCGGSSSLSSSSNIDLTSLSSTCASSSSNTNIVLDENQPTNSKLATHTPLEANANRRSLSIKTAHVDFLYKPTCMNKKAGEHHEPSSSSFIVEPTPRLQSPPGTGSVAGIAASFLSNFNSSSINGQVRSNSVSVKQSQQSATANPPNGTTAPSPNRPMTTSSTSSLNYSLSVSHRKPSFKFENNTILNRVQNMNINKIKFNKTDKPQQPSLNLNINEVKEEHNNNPIITNKRNSLNRESFYSNETTNKLIKRQQSINKIINSQSILANCSSTSAGNGVVSHQQQQQQSQTTGTNNVVPTIVSNANNQVKIGENRSNQISLDSGIYLPSESEDIVPVII